MVEVMDVHKNYASAAAMFDRCLQDNSNMGRIMIASIRALGSIVPQIEQVNLEVFQALIPTIVRGLHTLCQAAMENTLPSSAVTTYVEIIIEMVEDSPHFFDPQLYMTYENVMVVVESTAAHAALRHICLELVVSLCTESTKKTRKIVDPKNKGGKNWFGFRVFPTCVRMMVDIRADPSWEMAERPEETAEGADDCDVGEIALDR